MQTRGRLTRSQEVPDLPAPRSPFNTGSMDITTAGATQSLCGHELPTEKTIIIVRHGLTTWNEQSRIQASFRLISMLEPEHTSGVVYCSRHHCWLQGTADDPDLTPYGQDQAIRARNALSRMHIDRSGLLSFLCISMGVLSNTGRSLLIHSCLEPLLCKPPFCLRMGFLACAAASK